MELVLRLSQQVTRRKTRRIVHLHHPRLTWKSSKSDIFYDILDAELPEPKILDGAMFGFVHLAMQRACKFRIGGPVSRQALRNIQTFQEAWHCWNPEKYRLVDIIAEEVLPDLPFLRMRNDEAIACFSGGVDATFLALRNAQRRPESYELKNVVTIHGFDIDLAKTTDFEKLVSRTDPLLQSLGLKRIVVATDFKTKNLQDWEDCYGAQAACVLHQLSDSFSHGLIGSSNSYNATSSASGSTAATDYLMSGANFQIVHDGAGFTRTHKVELIAKNPLAMRGLKVCWQGKHQGENCGVCEKCMRTRLNFLAVGVENPGCFPQPFHESMIDDMAVPSLPLLSELISIMKYACEHNLKGPWVKRLEGKVARCQSELNASQTQNVIGPATIARVKRFLRVP